MLYVLLSVSGRDRPGICRDMAESLLHLQANIEDSSMTALRGRFVMMLIVRLAAGASLSALRASLAELEQRTGLTIQSQPMTEDEVSARASEPDCMVTVNGADKPGIVHAVTSALAEAGNSVIDMSTRTVETEDDGEKYMMALEIAANEPVDGLRARLARVADSTSVDIEVHTLETNVL
ncbi:MAG: glycine cleavage system protein R [Mariprofundaceae bacterium]